MDYCPVVFVHGTTSQRLTQNGQFFPPFVLTHEDNVRT